MVNEPGATNQPVPQVPPSNQIYYCQECGQPVPVGSTYCPNCGSFKLGPNPPSRIPRPAGVTILGIIQIIMSLIIIVVGVGMGAVLAATSPGLAGLGAIMAFLAILPLIFAIAFLTGRNWGRILMMIGAIIELIDFPVGTIIGIIILWYLTRPRVKAYFKQPK